MTPGIRPRRGSGAGAPTDFPSAIKALCDDYDIKVAAVQFLARLGDPPGAPVLAGHAGASG